MKRTKIEIFSAEKLTVWFIPTARKKIKHVSFVWSKKEKDARSPIYPPAAAPGHELEILRLGKKKIHV